MKIGGKAQRVKLLESEVVETNGTPGEVLDEKMTIACLKRAIRVRRLQRAGKQAQDAAEFLRGNEVEAII